MVRIMNRHPGKAHAQCIVAANSAGKPLIIEEFGLNGLGTTFISNLTRTLR